MCEARDFLSACFADRDTPFTIVDSCLIGVLGTDAEEDGVCAVVGGSGRLDGGS